MSLAEVSCRPSQALGAFPGSHTTSLSQVYPIVDFPVPEIARASQRGIAEHSAALGSRARILQQVNGGWDGAAGSGLAGGKGWTCLREVAPSCKRGKRPVGGACSAEVDWAVWSEGQGRAM